MARLIEQVDALQAGGSYTFSSADLPRTATDSEVARRAALGRLVRKGRIVALRRGFYVIVPLEYRTAGAPPPAWWIDPLMTWEERPYYVGLLSAAALHGAAHQAPQEFQVVTDRPLREIEAGRHRVRFVVKTSIAATSTVAVSTPTGTMRVSAPEATALDLVRYAKVAGHLEHVAGVLSELAERMDAAELAAAAEQGPVEIAVVQRLGYLLESTGHPNLAKGLWSLVDRSDAARAPLLPELPRRGRVDPRWRLIVNGDLEVDA